MARSSTRKETLPIAPKDAFKAAEDVVQKLNWQLIESNPAAGEIKVRTKSSLKTWDGEGIVVQVLPESSGSSIEITSKANDQLFDWGKSEDNVKDFFSQLSLEVLKLKLS